MSSSLAQNTAMDLLVIFHVNSATELSLGSGNLGDVLVWRRGARNGAISIDAATEDVLRQLGASDDEEGTSAFPRRREL